jgi:hypothetical protein
VTPAALQAHTEAEAQKWQPIIQTASAFAD